MDVAGPRGRGALGRRRRGRPGRLGRRRGRLRDRRRLGHRRVAGGAGRRPALGPGDRGRSPGSDPRLPRGTGSERRRRNAGGLAEPVRERQRRACVDIRRHPTTPVADRAGSSKAAGSTLVAISLADQSEVWRTPLGETSRSGVTIDGTNAFVGDTGRDGVRRLAGDGRDLLVRGDGRARRLGRRRLRRTGGRGRPEHRHGAGRRGRVRRGDGGAFVAGARDPGELHGGDRGLGGRRFAVHRFGGPARAGPRRRGRDRAMGDAGALAVLPGDRARVRRPERVRGGHRRGAVPAGCRRRRARVELPPERGGAAELAGRLRRLGPVGAGRRPSGRDRRGLRPPRLAERPVSRAGRDDRARERCGHRRQGGSRRRADRVRTRPGGHADRRPLADRARGRDHADALGARGGHRLRRGVRPGAVGQAALRRGRPGRGRRGRRDASDPDAATEEGP